MEAIGEAVEMIMADRWKGEDRGIGCMPDGGRVIKGAEDEDICRGVI